MDLPGAVSEEVTLSPPNIILGKRDHGQGILIENANPNRCIALYKFEFKTGFGTFHRGFLYTSNDHSRRLPPANTWRKDQHRGIKSFRMQEYHRHESGDRVGEDPDNEIRIRAHIEAQSGVDVAFDNHVILPERIISNRTQENLRHQREKYYFALYPLAPGGDIFEALQAFDSEEMCKVVFRQVFKGVQYLHNLNIFHNDLKPENIVSNKERNVAHIIDFGQAIVVNDGANLIEKTNSGYGTPLYNAPELHFSNCERTFDWRKADVWALGVSLYMMLIKDYPFWTQGGKLVPVHPNGIFRSYLGPDSQDRFHNFLRNDQNLYFPLSEDAIDLLHRMLIGDVSDRISIEGILSHRWLSS